jgi:hypothetical protein
MRYPRGGGQYFCGCQGILSTVGSLFTQWLQGVLKFSPREPVISAPEKINILHSAIPATGID